MVNKASTLVTMHGREGQRAAMQVETEQMHVQLCSCGAQLELSSKEPQHARHGSRTD